VREIARGECAVGQHCAARVTGGADARPAIAVVVPVRGKAALELALRHGDTVAMPPVGHDRRTAARVDPLRASLRQLRIDRETRANGYDRIVVANTSVHELRDRADVG